MFKSFLWFYYKLEKTKYFLFEAQGKKDDFLKDHKLPPGQMKAFRDIIQCRTSALGGHIEQCINCGYTRPAYNSCRNRHCPGCQFLKKAMWADNLAAMLPPVKHFHVVFTLPECLHKLFYINQDKAYNLFFKAATKALTQCTLNHNKVNQISDSNFDENRKWNGLSPFGLDVIKEMNRLGIMIDISHSTDSTVFQSLRYSEAPIIASHSSCRHFTPGLERNLSDTLIKAIANKNGVIMVNLCSMFLDSTCMENCSYLLNWYQTNGIDMDSEEGIDFALKYGETHQIKSNSEQVVDHIEHIIKLVGIDYVGIGSDYDGMGPSQPTDLPDVSCYPTIVFELLKRGYSENDIKKILSGNYLRVWNQVLEIADS